MVLLPDSEPLIFIHTSGDSTIYVYIHSDIYAHCMLPFAKFLLGIQSNMLNWFWSQVWVTEISYRRDLIYVYFTICVGEETILKI